MVGCAAAVFLKLAGVADACVIEPDPTYAKASTPVATGGCRDGLHPDGVNQNQGAESTLAWLHSLLRLLQVQQAAVTSGVVTDAAKRRLDQPPAA